MSGELRTDPAPMSDAEVAERFGLDVLAELPAELHTVAVELWALGRVAEAAGFELVPDPARELADRCEAEAAQALAYARLRTALLPAVSVADVAEAWAAAAAAELLAARAAEAVTA